VHIANEEAKFGFDRDGIINFVNNPILQEFDHIKIVGLMGMATNTSNQDQIRMEFKDLKSLFEELKASKLPKNVQMTELSMGMSGDYKIALEEGSTMVRIGSSIFGLRVLLIVACALWL
jgi:PLP dependent protein